MRASALLFLSCAPLLMGSCGGAVTSASAPVITGFSPINGFIGTDTIVFITGRNFQQSAAITVGPDPGITVSQVQFISPTRLNATFTIAGNATQSRRSITVRNPDGGDFTFEASFGVIGLGPGITVTNVNPNTGSRGGTVAVTITGTGFPNGAAVFADAGIEVSDVVVESLTRITARFIITDGATLGNHRIVVANPNGFGNSCQGCFAVQQ